MGKKLELKGQKFGMLLVVEEAGKNKRGNFLWECICDCGNKIIVAGGHLNDSHTKSCGCFRKDTASKRFKTHGMRGTRLYSIFISMLNRVNNKKHDKYKYYGGRGITICNEWLNNRKTFFDWAKDNGYKDNLTIDRIDNNGNYCPENCRFLDMKTQCRNRNNNVSYKGEYQTDACQRLGGNDGLITRRLKLGWSPEKAFTTPVIKT